MNYRSWNNFLRRKTRTARTLFNFASRAVNDTVDWGNGKSYKFDGKRWKKIEEQDDLELQVTDNPEEVSETVLPSSIALNTTKVAVETTQTELDAAKIAANATQVELDVAKTALAATQTELAATQTELATKATAASVNVAIAAIPEYTHPATHNASMLTGVLPAISGANLTNLPEYTHPATHDASGWNSMRMFRASNGFAVDAFVAGDTFNTDGNCKAGTIYRQKRWQLKVNNVNKGSPFTSEWQSAGSYSISCCS